MQRRKLLKTTGALLAGGIVVPQSIGAARAEKSGLSTWVSPRDTYQNGQIDDDRAAIPDDSGTNTMYALSSELYTSGGYDANGSWEFAFHLQGDSVCRHYYSGDSPTDGWKADRITEQFVRIYDSNSTGSIETSDAAKRLGGYPAPQYTAYEGARDIVEVLATSAIGRLDDVASGVIAASNVYDKLYSEYSKNESDTSGEDKKYVWKYSSWNTIGDKHSDVGHHIDFDYQLPYDTSAVFNIQQQTKGMLISDYATVEWQVQVNSPSGSSTASTMSTTSSEQQGLPSASSMSQKERKQYGIKKIPKVAAEKAGFEIPKDAVIDGNMIWFMSKPPITARPVSSTN